MSMDQLADLVSKISDIVWNSILLYLLVGTGVLFTIRTRFVQIRKFGAGWKRLFGNFSLNGEKAGKDGMSPFQALTTAIAAQVGTGNIAGAATALYSGGPGAIFWMWLSAFFGMSTIYGEAVLAQKYKTVDKDGHVTGGPIYYIKARFKGGFGTFLAGFFSIAIIFALGFAGNMVQSNSISAAFNSAFGIDPMIVGVIVAVLAGFIFLGGIGRIASVTEKLVPIMAVFYILGALILIIMNIGNFPEALRQIFVGAFNPGAALGGFTGVAVSSAIQFGVARGLFSNEAGMGSTPHAHAVAKVDHPCDQGLVAICSVFIDTLIVLNLTAFSVLCTGQLQEYNQSLTAAELTQAAFESVYGHFGAIFIAICMFFFAFSTIIGWYFFGEKNVRYLFKHHPAVAAKVYAAIVVVFIVVGSMLKVDLVWNLSDLFNSLMVIPNVLGLWALSNVAKDLYDDWKKQPAKVK